MFGRLDSGSCTLALRLAPCFGTLAPGPIPLRYWTVQLLEPDVGGTGQLIEKRPLPDRNSLCDGGVSDDICVCDAVVESRAAGKQDRCLFPALVDDDVSGEGNPQGPFAPASSHY